MFDQTKEEFIIEMDELDERSCWRLMSGVGFGRVAFVRDGQPLAFPVNCGVIDETVFFLTAQDSILHTLGGGETVAFEMDEADHVTETGWSVLIKGRAFELADDFERARLAELHIHPWAPGDRSRWMRIVPSAVTGRQIRRHHVPVEGAHLPYMPPD